MEITARIQVEGTDAPEKRDTSSDRLRRWTAGLFISAIAGGLSGLIGLVMSGAAELGVVEHTDKAYAAGTLLIGASFLLFGLAAHCADKRQETEKALRFEAYRRHTMLRNG